jgi:hypothetical protein
MKGRSGNGRPDPPTLATPCRNLQTVSQVLVLTHCPGTTCDVTSGGGSCHRIGMRTRGVGPLSGSAPADSATSGPGVSGHGRIWRRSDCLRSLPLDWAGRGGFPSPGSYRTGSAVEDGNRGGGALGGGAGARPGAGPGHRAPGQLGTSRRLAGLAWDACLGDLSSLPGGTARTLRARTARARGGPGHPLGRTAAAGPAGPAAGRGRRDPRGPCAAGRLGAVRLLRTGVSLDSRPGAAGPGGWGARAPRLPGLPTRRNERALRAGDRPGGDPDRGRLPGGRDRGHAPAEPRPGGLDP